MSVVVTSGGTRVPIDDIRYIGNFSKGSFGAKIVKACERLSVKIDEQWGRLETPLKVHHIRAKDSIKPDLLCHTKKYYQEYIFETYDEYAEILEKVLKTNVVDLLFSAAAVSDYGIIPASGKISSEQEELVIKLHKLPKILPKVKEWSADKSPTLIQVGFKLLSGVSYQTLINTAIESGEKANSDYTIANDYQSYKDGNPGVYIYSHKDKTIKVQNVKTQEQVNQMVEFIFMHSGLGKRWSL